MQMNISPWSIVIRSNSQIKISFNSYFIASFTLFRYILDRYILYTNLDRFLKGV